jgi:uncharacterized protein YbaR (Trm112 family)
MEAIYCPVCSRPISSQAKITACPNCYQPLNVQVWKEVRAKRVAIEKEKMRTAKDKIKTRTKAQLIKAYNIQKKIRRLDILQ